MKITDNIKKTITTAFDKKDREAKAAHDLHIKTLREVRENNIKNFIDLFACCYLMKEAYAKMEAENARVLEAADKDPQYNPPFDDLPILFNETGRHLNNLYNSLINDGYEIEFSTDLNMDQLVEEVKKDINARLNGTE